MTDELSEDGFAALRLAVTAAKDHGIASERDLTRWLELAGFRPNVANEAIFAWRNYMQQRANESGESDAK